MPTYDYVCESCGHAFEKFQSITAKPAKKCPECGKMKLNRLIGSGAGVIFKGTGFYETDYRSDSYKQAQKGESTASSSSSDTKKSDSSESKTKSDSTTTKKESPGGDKKKKTA
ncbi:putative regulatory protein, FmdB family [Anaerohalosphaera lusitana]|uniref:Putative regulatory protein, FmdB family n=1 Tax=Anaerohalosphaera lusitana TaxID=1936003 RepID=A0A1U9NQP6_9BACT|nr:zinc ribbon domain-containing protein [Anaerohalosphaera lusitana]AQT70253.1 putative regulatory protein, FmdB family [Anaerohalosphaera lusitana]